MWSNTVNPAQLNELSLFMHYELYETANFVHFSEKPLLAGDGDCPAADAGDSIPVGLLVIWLLLRPRMLLFVFFSGIFLFIFKKRPE